jgi:benzoate membrane transport protein
VAAIILTGAFNVTEQLTWGVVLPTLVRPEFSPHAMLELVIPLAITVIVVQNGQGIAVLKAAKHDTPINAVTTACGVFSMITAAVGTASTCLAGPTNALACASGERRRQYTAGVFIAVLGLVFGLYSSLFTHLMLASPSVFVAALAGLAMLRILQTAVVTAFGGKCTFGALITFLVTLADVPIFNLGAPFWGLVIGCVVAWTLERDEYVESLSKEI